MLKLIISIRLHAMRFDRLMNTLLSITNSVRHMKPALYDNLIARY